MDIGRSIGILAGGTQPPLAASIIAQPYPSDAGVKIAALYPAAGGLYVPIFTEPIGQIGRASCRERVLLIV